MAASGRADGGEVGGDGVVMLVLAGMVRVVVVMAGDLRMEKQMR